jgi:hypothetical protein
MGFLDTPPYLLLLNVDSTPKYGVRDRWVSVPGYPCSEMNHYV